MATFVPLVVLAFAIGLYPKPLFQILEVPVNNLVATIRPDYPGLTKPVLAVEPAKNVDPDAPTPLPEPPAAPEVKAPATTSNPGGTGVTKQAAPAAVKTAQMTPAAATAGAR
jgi:NADH-quinone oxidoreductase subunit M